MLIKHLAQNLAYSKYLIKSLIISFCPQRSQSAECYREQKIESRKSWIRQSCQFHGGGPSITSRGACLLPLNTAPCTLALCFKTMCGLISFASSTSLNTKVWISINIKNNSYALNGEVNDMETKSPSADFIELSLIFVKYIKRIVSSFKGKLKLCRTSELCWSSLGFSHEPFICLLVAERWNPFKQAAVPKIIFFKGSASPLKPSARAPLVYFYFQEPNECDPLRTKKKNVLNKINKK